MPLGAGLSGADEGARTFVHAHPALLEQQVGADHERHRRGVALAHGDGSLEHLRGRGILVFAALHPHQRAYDRRCEAGRLERARLRGIGHDAEVHARRREAERGLSVEHETARHAEAVIEAAGVAGGRQHRDARPVARPAEGRALAVRRVVERGGDAHGAVGLRRRGTQRAASTVALGHLVANGGERGQALRLPVTQPALDAGLDAVERAAETVPRRTRGASAPSSALGRSSMRSTGSSSRRAISRAFVTVAIVMMVLRGGNGS